METQRVREELVAAAFPGVALADLPFFAFLVG